MEVENYISLLEKCRRVVRERDGLVIAIRNLKEIIAEDKHQEIDGFVVTEWTKYMRSDYEQNGGRKVSVNAKNLLKYYESELKLITHKLNVMQDKINREKLSSW